MIEERRRRKMRKPGQERKNRTQALEKVA